MQSIQLQEVSCEPGAPHSMPVSSVKLWSSPDDLSYFPVANTCKLLPPDVYELKYNNGPIFFRINFDTEDLVVFEDDTVNNVIKEIQRFWDSKQKFEDFGFTYRRGVLLYGPAGSGKSSAVKMILKKVIAMGGVGFQFDNVNVFKLCVRAFRMIQPETPIVAIMEDLESIVGGHADSEVLNLLDGVDGFDNIVYLATTNYPEMLEQRIANRPSRFDRRFHVDYLNPASREVYLRHLMSKMDEKDISKIKVPLWVKDTDKFTPAHIKELFISVVLYEENYESALKTILEMRKKISSEDTKFRRTGFSSSLLANAHEEMGY